MAERVPLDSAAVLALLQAESGAPLVAAAIADGAITAICRTEILAHLGRYGGDGTAALDGLGLPVLPFDMPDCDRAARLLVAHRGVLSLGDCACLATAEALGLPVLTADRIRATLGLKVEVRLIR